MPSAEDELIEVTVGAVVSTTKVPVGLLLKVGKAFPAVSNTVPENEATAKSLEA